VIIRNINKTTVFAKVTVEVEADELLSLLHAVQQCDLYDEMYTISLQSKLYSELSDAVTQMRMAPEAQ